MCLSFLATIAVVVVSKTYVQLKSILSDSAQHVQENRDTIICRSIRKFPFQSDLTGVFKQLGKLMHNHDNHWTVNSLPGFLSYSAAFSTLLRSRLSPGKLRFR